MMKRNQLFKICCTILFAMLSLQIIAQNNFNYKAQLSEVKQPGFYKIILSPQVVGKSQFGLTDLRILNEKNNQVPYIIKQDAAEFLESSFIEFPIINKTKEKDKQTHITIENKAGKAINDLLLVTSNMDAKRVVNISGSNDLKEWFIIKDGIYLDNYFSRKEEELVQTISLPTVNYKYFQVTIVGKDILPFNVAKAGIYKENYTQGKYVSIPSPTIIQKDGLDKRSSILLQFNEAYNIDKLVLEIEGPKFYKRWLSTYLGNHLTTKFPFSATISSDTTELFLNGMKSKDFLLMINNEDNLPLKIKAVNAFQLNQYVLAYLEAGSQYHLAFGDSLANAANYDLKFFKDSIGKNPPTLSIGNIEETKPVALPIQVKSRNNKILLWSIIAAISILLLFFTFKMTKEIKNRNSHADI